jgi:hypothetical protein
MVTAFVCQQWWTSPQISSIKSPMMGKSLKSYVPRLAKLLGMTPDSLYERVRALVREGLLTPEAGRGPGSGVRATPETVTLLLIAGLAADSLSDVGKSTREFAELPSRAFDRSFTRSRKMRCPLTGASRFRDALVKIISDPQMAERVQHVNIQRDEKEADILFRTLDTVNELELARVFFSDGQGANRDAEGQVRGIEVRARIKRPVLVDIARDLEHYA